MKISLLSADMFSSRESPEPSIITRLPLRNHVLIRIRMSRFNSLPPSILPPHPQSHEDRKSTTSRSRREQNGMADVIIWSESGQKNKGRRQRGDVAEHDDCRYCNGALESTADVNR